MKRAILSCEELHSFLRSCGIVYLVGYDAEFDPIRYFVFVMTGRAKRRLEGFVNGRRLQGKYSAGRIVRVVHLDRLISRKWRKDILSRSAVDADGIRVLAYEDFRYLGLVYILTQSTRSYVTKNILMHYGIEKLGDNNEGLASAYPILFDYMKASGYRLNLSAITDGKTKTFAYYRKYNMLSLWDMICISWVYLKSRVHKFRSQRIKQRYEDFAVKSMTEHRQSVPDFVKFAVERLGMFENYEVLERDNGYGCTFMRVGNLFIKGNENTELTNSVRNELKAQKILAGLPDSNKRLFICMESFCDEGKQFIVYPFVHGVTLSAYCSENGSLPPSELEELGSYLVRTLDALYEAGIVHRDFASQNIMYSPDEGDKFRLFDFGCAYSGEPDIISDNEYFDAKIKQIVGDSLRYDCNIWDDADSAYCIYLLCGGNPDDQYARKIKSLIGRSYKA